MTSLDVLFVGDLRFAGGSGRRLAEEIVRLIAHGASVGVFPVRTGRFRRGTPWNARIADVLRDLRVPVVAPDQEVRAGAVVLRQPALLPDVLRAHSRVTAEQVILVANHGPVEDGSDYDPVEIDRRVRDRFGTDPEWHPVTNAIRSELVRFPALRHRVSTQNWPQSPVRHAPPFEAACEWRGAMVHGSANTIDSLSGPGASRLTEGASEENVRKIWVAGPDVLDWNECEMQALGAIYNGYQAVLPAAARQVLGWSGPVYEPDELGAALDLLVTEVPGQRATVGIEAHNGHVEEALARRLRLDAVAQPLDGAVRPHVSAPTARPVVLFVTSNGAGMGHLTRELGIARALGNSARPIFVSLSQGVPVVQQYGFRYEYVPFTSALKNPANEWNDYFHERLVRAIRLHEAAAVVFDGVWPYGGLIRALRDTGVCSVWVRRGMWKPHISPDQLRKAHSFDLVIEPGDYAASKDRGATTLVEGALKVDPITVVSLPELLSGEAAREQLGLPADRKLALVTLGAGNINDIGDVQAEFVGAVETLGPDWSAVVTTPLIAETVGFRAAYNVSVFPLAKYANAFDFAVSATGYNSYHEWITAGLPTIWVPNQNTVTDDQTARGDYAGEAGLGIVLQDPTSDSIVAAVRSMAQPDVRERMRSRSREIVRPNGASQAAAAIMAKLEDVR